MRLAASAHLLAGKIDETWGGSSGGRPNPANMHAAGRSRRPRRVPFLENEGPWVPAAAARAAIAAVLALGGCGGAHPLVSFHCLVISHRSIDIHTCTHTGTAIHTYDTAYLDTIKKGACAYLLLEDGSKKCPRADVYFVHGVSQKKKTVSIDHCRDGICTTTTTRVRSFAQLGLFVISSSRPSGWTEMNQIKDGRKRTWTHAIPYSHPPSYAEKGEERAVAESADA